MRFFCVLSVLGLCVASSYADPNDPNATITYVSTPDELDDIRLNLSGTFVLTDNIDLSGISFDPIDGFTGCLDGQGYAVVNLTITRPIEPGSANNRIGLFAKAENADLRNLSLVNAQVQGNKRVAALAGWLVNGTVTNCRATGSATGFEEVGGLVGRAEGSSFYRCNATTDVTGFDDDPNSEPVPRWAGGLVGHLHIDNTIRRCSAHGSVTGSKEVGGLAGTLHGSQARNCFATGSVNGRLWVGGLFGNLQEEPGKETSVEKSYATGPVVTGSYPPQLTEYPAPGSGGLIGQLEANGSVERSFATGQVKNFELNTGYNQNRGGLVGLLEDDASVDDSFALGDVLDPNGTGISIGGLVGWADGDVTNCFARGRVQCYEKGGGLIGQAGGTFPITVRDCYATGAVTQSITVGDIGDGVGGLVGYTFDAKNGIRTRIVDCFATGDVHSEGGNHAGGLVGFLWDAEIERSYASGNVTSKGEKFGGLVGEMVIQENPISGQNTGQNKIIDCYASGRVEYTGTSSGNQRFGGLVGRMDGSLPNLVQNSFSFGAVVAGTATGAGGLIGSKGGTQSTVTSSYWDTDTSGLSTSAGGSGAPTCGVCDDPNNPSGMKNQCTYSGWNFTATWSISEDATYPYLTWQLVAPADDPCP